MPVLFPITFFDAPIVLDTTVTPIPANSSSTLEVIANSGTRASYAVQWIDSTGEYIGIYVGPIGHEQLICVVGGGTASVISGVVGARNRVSIRSMRSTAITNGTLFCAFLGQGWA